MNENKQPQLISLDQVEKIIQDLEDGVISPKDLAWLKKNIKLNPDVRKLYFQHMELVALLKRGVRIREDSGSLPVTEVTIGLERRKMTVISLTAGIAAMLLLCLGFYFFHAKQRQLSEPAWVLMEQSGDALCTITTSDGETRQHGELLPGDHIHMEQGLVKLLFPSGVEAIIEGPSDLKLLSESELSMHQGAAWFRVPEAGHGFTVTTDRAKIIDLGTEFGLRFDGSKNLQVHVNKGKVRIEPALSAMKQVALIQNQAMAFNVYGQGKSIKAEPSLFRKQFTDSIPYLHWSFDHMVDGYSPATGTIPGVKGYGARLKHLHRKPSSIKSSDHQTEGKFGSALSLHGDNVFAATAFAGIGENAPRTFAAWVRHRKNNPSKLLSPYCTWGTRETGKLWQISIENGGRLRTGLMEAPFKTSEPVDARQEGWMHIAVVYTGQENKQGNPDIRHYINGVKQAMLMDQSKSKVMTDLFSTSAKPVRFGATLEPDRLSRSVDGDIDEVFIFHGVLNETQIQQLMHHNQLDFFQN